MSEGRKHLDLQTSFILSLSKEILKDFNIANTEYHQYYKFQNL